MPDPHCILIVDDDPDILTAGRLLLSHHFGKVICCSDPHQIPRYMAQHRFNAVLLDMNFSPGARDGQAGFDWLNRILAIDPETVVVMITAHGGVDTAVEAIRQGATDFIAKPWQNEKVVATLSAAMALSDTRQEAAALKRSNQRLLEANRADDSRMIGSSSAMQQVHSIIRKAAPTDANVLILGENGTGKELVARQLHAQSTRAEAVFVSIDLGAVSESLFESELFGHHKGAFTGADKGRTGRLLAADGGTLFLDEIGNIPLHLQVKLLTVLEQRQVIPLGSTEPIELDVRVVAATNLPRHSLGNEQLFRQDLLFRLNTVEILLPPLRDRAEDIPEIALHFARQYARKYRKPDKLFSADAMHHAMHNHWPGNVRALRHAVERAVILSEGEALESVDLQLDTLPDSNAASPDDRSLSQAAPVPEPDQDLNLERTERQLVVTALKRHQYNISKAAADLGITRTSLYRRMDKHGL